MRIIQFERLWIVDKQAIMAARRTGLGLPELFHVTPVDEFFYRAHHRPARVAQRLGEHCLAHLTPALGGVDAAKHGHQAEVDQRQTIVEGGARRRDRIACVVPVFHTLHTRLARRPCARLRILLFFRHVGTPGTGKQRPTSKSIALAVSSNRRKR